MHILARCDGCAVYALRQRTVQSDIGTGTYMRWYTYLAHVVRVTWLATRHRHIFVRDVQLFKVRQIYIDKHYNFIYLEMTQRLKQILQGSLEFIYHAHVKLSYKYKCICIFKAVLANILLDHDPPQRLANLDDPTPVIHHNEPQISMTLPPFYIITSHKSQWPYPRYTS